MKRVIFDMNNPNTLVALAYIKSNDNPLAVFCNYIVYLISTSSNKALRIDELSEGLSQRFGLKMPLQMIRCCIQILKKRDEVEVLPNGGRYAIKSTQFNIHEFESNLERLQIQENAVITSIVGFVKEKHNTDWSSEQAKKYLSSFLDGEGNGARLFLNGEIDTDSKHVSPSWYIGRYVSHIQKLNDCLEKTYLENIVNGMMIYEGVFYIGDYQQDKSQKFKGTTFYLDTKLILRALGFSWGAQVQSAKELINLITKEYGGRIGIFQQTLIEVQGALKRAGDEYANGRSIYDNELRMYAELNPSGANLLSELSTTVMTTLSKEFNVLPPPDIDWNSYYSERNTIDVQGITEFICNQNPTWKRAAVTYDAEIINQINILRRGNYSERYGGRRKLPVFVTSNAGLVYAFKDYVCANVDSNGSFKWNEHALPVISDNMILFRLWVPVANQYSNLPALTLSRYAYSAQNPDTQYFKKMREDIEAYQKDNKVSFVDLSEIRRQKLEDIIIRKTHGSEEQLSADIVATSVDELVKIENLSLHKRINDLTETVDKDRNRLARQENQIIRLAAKEFADKIGISRLLIWAAQMWWLISAVILGAVGYLATSNPISVSVSVLPLLINVVLSVIDELSDKAELQAFMVKFVVKYSWKKYVKRIVSRLSDEERVYKKEIIRYCLDNTPLFKKYEQFCDTDLHI